MAWDPQQYALFGSHRGRPFVDLLGRVAATEPDLVVDLGCGDGPLTLTITCGSVGSEASIFVKTIEIREV